MRTLSRIVSSFILILVSLLAFSCLSRNDKLSTIDAKVDSGDYEAAYTELGETKKSIYSNKDDILYLMDTGMLSLYANNFNRSIDELTDADVQMDELRKKNIGEQIGASIVNDSVITYNGYNYEYVFTSIMLSLGYLMEQKFDDGFVEIRRTQNKLEKIQVDNKVYLSEYNKNKKDKTIDIKDIKAPFVDSAFTRLLSFWLYRADFDFTNMEVAARKYVDAIEAQPKLYNFTPPEISDDQFKTNSTRIQIVSLTDRSPILYSKRFSLNFVENGVIIQASSEAARLPSNLHPIEDEQLLENMGLIALPGMNSGGLSIVFDVPKMATFDNKVDYIEVWLNGERTGNLELTENLENISVESFKEESKLIYARQISRVIIKAVSGVAANEVDPLLGLFTQIVTNVSERADLRTTRFFPAKIWTGDFELIEAGEYNIVLKYYRNATLLREQEFQKNISAGDNFNLILDSLL